MFYQLSEMNSQCGHNHQISILTYNASCIMSQSVNYRLDIKLCRNYTVIILNFVLELCLTLHIL